MLAESNGSPYAGDNAPKLRTACENCRQSKVKCNLSGKNVCTRCLRHGLQCQYGFANRSGKPKGSKNRATLRKLGQLQEDKPPIRGFRGNRIVPPVANRESRVATEYPSHMGDPMMDDDICLIPGPPGLWESPRSFGSAAALDTPICPSQLATIDGSPFTDLMDSCPTMPLGLGYPHTPVTPTFLSSAPLIDRMGSPSLAGSVSSPYSAAPCECVDKQIFYMNRLNHLLAESMPLRFDHSLQAVKATFCACQVFMQCDKCTKDSANLLLVISVLNLTLQLFEYWISRETSRMPQLEPGDIRYGYYEVGQDDNRQIRAFLLRKLLLQCKNVLSMLTTAVNTVCLDNPKFLDGEGSADSSMKSEGLVNQPWASSGHSGTSLSHPESGAMSGPGNKCLLPIIGGYEATVEAFLQSVSSDCICGSEYSGRDEPL
ncbi:uncharacterized protein N7484_006246 [Penicillium longicatenatum]|uniref:uncharacterized protein n=1 Tax=Penicillium longicatenatum TaxID=1561947 RepID=UPI0025492891|nr:uncharacterized protein N7484_006246 [Penicillium longicatenatum]KAJ5643739.1 hypothetical protein N7484_006246 [Penicillium longicatenatum]